MDISDLLDENEQEIEEKLRKKPLEEAIESKPKKKKDRVLEKYLEDYYKLDFEDIVAGIPTRFKYRTVQKQDYGLKVDEILAAEDQDLNQVISLKKLAPYRAPEKIAKDEQKFKKQKKKLLYEFRGRKKLKKQQEEEEVTVGNERLESYNL